MDAENPSNSPEQSQSQVQSAAAPEEVGKGVAASISWKDARALWLVRAVMVVVLSIIALAVQMGGTRRASSEARWNQAEWWAWPHVANPEMALPQVDGEIHALYVQPGKQRVWMTGTRGLLAYSDDDGRTWAHPTVELATSFELPQPDSVAATAAAPPAAPPAAAEAKRVPARRTNARNPAPRAAARDSSASERARPLEQTSGAGASAKLGPFPAPMVLAVAAARGFTAHYGPPFLVRGPWRRAWGPTSIDGRFSAMIRSIEFRDDSTGVALCDEVSLLMLRTTNGGRTWTAHKIVGDTASYFGGFEAHIGGSGQVTVAGLQVIGGAEIPTIVETDSSGVIDGGTHLVFDSRPLSVDASADGSLWIVDYEGTLSSSSLNALPRDLGVVNRVQDHGAAGVWTVGDSGRVHRFLERAANHHELPRTPLAVPLYASAALDSSTAMVCGDGAVFVTTDGGRNWKTSTAFGGAALRTITFRDAKHGWTASQSGEVFATSDGGGTWTRVARPGASLRAIEFVDAIHGWVGDAQGRISSTRDGGRTWRWMTTRVSSAVAKIEFVDGRNGLVSTTSPDARLSDVSYVRNLLWTQDRGRTWALGRSLSAVEQVAGFGSRGARRLSGGRLQATSDAGNSWRPLGPNRAWVALATLDGRYTWVAGASNDSSVLGRLDESADTLIYFTAPFRAIRTLAFADTSRGVAIARNGYAYYTADGARTWSSDGMTYAMPVTLDLSASGTGLLASADGRVYRTTDAGAKWTRLELPNPHPVRAVKAIDANHLWVAGDDDLLLASENGGATWADPRRREASLPPWFYLTSLLALGLLVPAVRRPKPQEAATPSVADVLVSDRPLRSTDPDALGFSSLAAAVSLFIRNLKTQPPLTIAITGKWGTGKSSLMNLVREDLTARGFQPVWFNAWHHQQEDLLLAALLQNVRSQAVPPAYSWRGLRFYARLLWRRSKRFAPWLFVLAILLPPAIGYLATNTVEHLSNVLKFVRDAAFAVRSIFGDKDVKLPSADDSRSVLSLAVAIVGSVITYRKGIQAFGMDPARLLGSVSNLVSVRDLQSSSGFRDRFATEFEEVAHSLHPLDMVIFIDDLDRCEPKNVLQVLEAINFLVSSGECVVVMGMDDNWVERCVAIAYGAVADELLESEVQLAGAPAQNGGGKDAAQSAEEEKRKRRVDFARRYLEKLVNLRIAVPSASSAGLSKVALPDPPKVVKRTPAQKTFKWFEKHQRVLVTSAMLALIGAYGFGVGAFNRWNPRAWWTEIARVASPAGSSTNAPVPVASDEDAPDASQGSASPSPTNATTVDSSTTLPTTEVARAAEIVGVSPPRFQLGLFIGLLFAVMLIGSFVSFRMRIQAESVSKDSEQFTKAINILAPLIFQKDRTPRSAKRFLNKVRFGAMRLRTLPTAAAAPATPSPATGAAPAAPATAGATVPGLKEEMLVALAAIEQTHPAWFKDAELYKDFQKFVLAHEKSDGFDVDDEQFKALFKEWGALDAPLRERFGTIMDSVRSN